MYTLSNARKRVITVRQTLRLGTISGIPIGLNWGLILIALFYLFNLGAGILPAAVPDQTAFIYWTFAAFGVVAFFASILAHELGHAIVAQRNNIGVRAITLWLLGGVAELEREADDPGVEFRIAIAGPAVSVALAVIFGALTFGVTTFFGSGIFAFTLGYLAIVNLGVAVFNMIPASPLDGGRVLTSVLWWRNDNRHISRAKSARVGEIFGNILLAVGIIGVFNGSGTYLLAFLGFFLRSAAKSERQRAQMFEAVSHADIATSMLPIAAPITSGITLSGLEAMAAPGGRAVAFPLWAGNGVIGLVPSTAIDQVSNANRPTRFVEDVVVSWDKFTSAFVDEKMSVVVERAREIRKTHVLVYDSAGRRVGYLPLDGSLKLLAPA